MKLFAGPWWIAGLLVIGLMLGLSVGATLRWESPAAERPEPAHANCLGFTF